MFQPKYRDFVRQLKEMGAFPIRQSGTSHEVWKLPNGKHLALVRNGNDNSEVTRNVLDSFKRAMRGA